MHKLPPLSPETTWLAAEGLPREQGRALLRLLAQLERAPSLRVAAQAAGMSYRHAWGLLGLGAVALGGPLADMTRGRGARLTALGQRVLQAESHARTILAPVLERLQEELREILADALPTRPRVRLRASHDLALGELARLCEARLDLEIGFQGADDSLAALARGDCELAGFHVADALPRAAAAAAALGRWLEPNRHQLVHFVTREQGLIVRPGSRIKGVHDLARPGVRFTSRPAHAGRSEANADLLAAAEVAEGRADAAFGLRAAAARYRLGFVPLSTERYFLAATRGTLRSAGFLALREVLRGKAFSSAISRLPGYDATTAGRQEAIGSALSWLQA